MSNNRRPSTKQQNEPISKLRLLMLHGYRQNEKAFRERSGGLRKALKNYVSEFVFCEAPHLISNNNQEETTKEEEEKKELNEKGWWFSSDSAYNALELTENDKGLNESLEYINQIFETKGPFDGILGFSQGACLAGLLCKLCEDQKYKFINFKFAIIIAGFKSNQMNHNIYYDLNNKIKLPSLHLIGKEDKVIPEEMATKLTHYFESPQVFFHNSGHLIPVNAESKNAIFEFLNKILI